MIERRSAAADRWKKAVAMGLSLFRNGFNPSKCKTSAKMAVARIKLLRNKREVVIRQMRRDIAMLLESGQDATARIRVEHVMREQNIMAANELIELFCELLVARLTIIAKQKECPPDLKEGISSLIFAGPRCSEIPELLSIRDVFQKKYGKDFVSAATELRSNAGVNRLLIEKLSVKTPPGELKLKVLKEIAKEYHVQWDTTETEEELLKPPEERIEGPNSFASASGLPLNPSRKKSLEPNDALNREQSNTMSFEDVASAAGFAAEKAAEAAALLAAYGGKQMSASYKGARGATVNDSNNVSRNSSIKFTPNGLPNSRAEYSTTDQSEDQRTVKTNGGGYSYYSPENEQQRVNHSNDVSRDSSRTVKTNGGGYSYYSPENEQQRVNHSNDVSHDSSRKFTPNSLPNSRVEYSTTDQSEDQRTVKTNDGGYSYYSSENEQQSVNDDRKMVNDDRKMVRRQSYNCQRAPTDIKFDESDCDEEIEMEEPPSNNTGKFDRRHSYNVPPARSNARYDEYDEDEDDDSYDEDGADEFRQPARGTTNQPPQRPAPQIPARRVHPKLPDYDTLAARFEALKQHKAQQPR